MSGSVKTGCSIHGFEKGYIQPCGRFVCRPCNYARVKRHRINVKATLIKEMGGACLLCGYNKCQRALEFHHLDPNIKEFTMSTNTCRSMIRAKKEAEKCVVLCANCHREVEDGMTEVPRECIASV